MHLHEKKIYLDNMSSTKVDETVITAMNDCMKSMAGICNPSTSHPINYEARKVIYEAESNLRKLINANFGNLIWTSGATESVNLALMSLLSFKNSGSHIITTEIEHSSTLKCCQHLEKKGFNITYLKPSSTGMFSISDFYNACNNSTVLISISHINSEIGTVTELTELIKFTKEKGILLHLDAAQSLGKISIDLAAHPIDLISFSAHKIHGPKGCGALYYSDKMRLTPIFFGGEQQNYRPGTLATPLIIGFGQACLNAGKLENINKQEYCLKLRNDLWEQITKNLDNIKLNGPPLQSRADNNLNFCVAGVNGDTLHYELGKKLIVSHGSACSASSESASHVLSALGLLPHEAFSSVRIGLSKFTTKKDIDLASEHIIATIKKIRKHGLK
jgi:cysteine desulfurase